MGVVLNEESMARSVQFEKMTGAGSRDCIMDEEHERMIFVVNTGEMGFAIGKKGVNIKKAADAFGKEVQVVEYSDDAAQFLRNCFHPAQIKEIQFTEVDDGRIAHVMVRDDDRGIAIGKAGRNINRAKELALRQHQIVNVILE